MPYFKLFPRRREPMSTGLARFRLTVVMGPRLRGDNAEKTHACRAMIFIHIVNPQNEHASRRAAGIVL